LNIQLKGITSVEYEDNRNEIKQKISFINNQIEAIEDVDESFYITAKSIIAVSKNAKNLFLSSEVDERKVLLQNVLFNITWIWNCTKPHYE